MAKAGMIRELVVGVSLAFDKSGYNAAETAIGKLGRDMRNFALSVSGAAGALFEIAHQSGQNSRELKVTAANLGITTDKLQELEYAAKIAGDMTRDELVSGLEGLSKTLFESRNRSSDASRSLLALGVNAKLLDNPLTTSDQLLGAISDKFAEMPDGIQKTALAAEVFGNNPKMISFLNEGSAGLKKLGIEAQKSGIVLGKGFIDQGVAYEKRLSKVMFVLKNISYTIGGQLMKYLTPMIESFQKWIGQNRQLLSMNIAVGLEAVGDVLKMIGRGAMMLADTIGQLGFIFKDFGGKATVVKALFVGWLLAVSPITTVLMAIGLAIQDVYTYMKGGDSYFGDFIKWGNKFHEFRIAVDIMKELGSAMATVAGWLYKLGSFGFDKIVGGLVGVLQAVNGDMATDKTDLTALQPERRKKQGLFDNAKFDSGQILNFSKNPNFDAGQIPKINQLAKGMTGTDGMNVNMQTQVTVQIPPGTSATDATNIVSSGVEDGLSKHLKAITNQKAGGRKN